MDARARIRTGDAHMNKCEQGLGTLGGGGGLIYKATERRVDELGSESHGTCTS
jgi:hypothetical protein